MLYDRISDPPASVRKASFLHRLVWAHGWVFMPGLNGRIT
jgi:hypothetical protein